MFKNHTQKKKLKCLLCQQKQKQLNEFECKHFICTSCFKKSIVQAKNKKLVACEQCQQHTKLNQKLNNQSVLRKSYKSIEKRKDVVKQQNNTNKYLTANNSKTTTVSKDIKINPFQINLECSNYQKQNTCNLHFNQKTHICTTCVQQVCIKCLQTICQYHKVLDKQKGINLIKKQFLDNRYAPKLEQTKLKFKHLNERKKFNEQKYLKINEEIKRNFNHIRQILSKKEQQIIKYCKSIYKKIDNDYDRFFEILENHINILNNSKNIILTEQKSVQSIKKQLKNISELKELTIDFNKKMEICIIVDYKKLEKILFQIQSIKIQEIKKQKIRQISTEDAQTNRLKYLKNPPYQNYNFKEH